MNAFTPAPGSNFVRSLAFTFNGFAVGTKSKKPAGSRAFCNLASEERRLR